MKVTIDFSVWQTQKDYCRDNKIKKNNLSNMIARGTMKTKVIPELNNIVLIRKKK